MLSKLYRRYCPLCKISLHWNSHLTVPLCFWDLAIATHQYLLMEHKKHANVNEWKCELLGVALDYTMVSTDAAVVLKLAHSWKLSCCHSSDMDVKFPYFPNHRNFPVSSFPLLSFIVIQIVPLVSSLHVEEKEAGHGGAVPIHRSVQ